jgi:hypothetical protein
MSGKKNTNPQAIRIGTRLRCTDDGVEGRIVWANGVSVKITWDDGEQVTWRRDALADKPIEFLDPEDDQAETPVTPEPTRTEQPQAEPEVPPAQAPVTEPTLAEEQPAPAIELPAVSALEPEAAPLATASEPAPAPERPKRQRKVAEPKEKRVNVLDAAARVLAEENRPMSCQEMIDVMAARGYWSSPKGATPAATLYSAVLRELTTKGSAARFVKTERGKFGRNPGA